MTHKQRVYAAFAHEQPDRCPYFISFTERAHDAMVAHFGGDDLFKLMDNDLVKFTWNPTVREGWPDEHTFQDSFGVRWDRSIDRDIGNVTEPLLTERNLDLLEVPDPTSPDRFEGLAEKCAANADKYISYSVRFSLFERAWSLRGMDKLMMDMIEAPDFVDALLDAICDFNCAIVEQAVKFPIDGVHFGDDWGTQRGLMMGPRLWERFIKPRLARQYAAAKRGGKFVSIHCCGKVQELFPELLDLGLDCFNPFQPEVMDVFEMKREFGDRLSFWGGVSTQKLLPYGTPDDVRREVGRLVTEVGKSGGYICSPAHDIPADAKPENVLAMIETLNNQ
jgi:uroporphyrinogen decarboxylase